MYVYYCQFYDNKLSYHKSGAELLQAREKVWIICVMKSRLMHCLIRPLRRLACSMMRMYCGEHTSPFWTSSRGMITTNRTAPCAMRSGGLSSIVLLFFPFEVSPCICYDVQMLIHSGRIIPNSKHLRLSPLLYQWKRKRRWLKRRWVKSVKPIDWQVRSNQSRWSDET